MFEASPDPKILKYAIAALAVAVAGLFIALDLMRRRKARRALAWPTVPGTVMTSRTARRWGFGHGVWMAGLWYVPEVVYRYETGGRTYTGRRVFLSDTGFSRRILVREIIDRYPRAARIMVRYNPRRPGEACLEPIYRDHRTIGIAVLMLVFAAATLLA